MPLYRKDTDIIFSKEHPKSSLEQGMALTSSPPRVGSANWPKRRASLVTAGRTNRSASRRLPASIAVAPVVVR